MDETVEEDVVEEIKEQIIEPADKTESVIITEELNNNSKLKFNDIDQVMTKNGTEEFINAPKTIDRLEEISAIRNMQRKMEEEDASDDDKLIISNEDALLDNLDVHVFGNADIKIDSDLFLDDIEILA